MDALNASLPQIYDEFEEDGVKKRVLNAADTEAAKDKLAKIKAAFETWVWKDVERADRLARITRPFQQPRPAALRRVASDNSRRLQGHQLLRPPEAGHLADGRFRHDLYRPCGRSGTNL